MEIYKYRVDREITNSKITAMVGKVIADVARGYVFAKNRAEAIKKLGDKYTSDDHNMYIIHLKEQTDIIEL